VRRSLFFRQRYNRHRYALDRSYSCRDRLLLLPCKLVELWAKVGDGIRR
jgi:hypothetical protein